LTTNPFSDNLINFLETVADHLEDFLPEDPAKTEDAPKPEAPAEKKVNPLDEAVRILQSLEKNTDDHEKLFNIASEYRRIAEFKASYGVFF
jgi:hypothetical protein